MLRTFLLALAALCFATPLYAKTICPYVDTPGTVVICHKVRQTHTVVVAAPVVEKVVVPATPPSPPPALPAKAECNITQIGSNNTANCIVNARPHKPHLVQRWSLFGGSRWEDDSPDATYYEIPFTRAQLEIACPSLTAETLDKIFASSYTASYLWPQPDTIYRAWYSSTPGTVCPIIANPNNGFRL